MRLLRRLYIRDFLFLFLLITVGLSAIFSLVDLIESFDDLTQGAPSVGDIVYYSLLRMPRYTVYLLPMSVLVCSLFIFSQAYRRQEITSVKASGGRLTSLFLPFVVIGLIISGLSFLGSEVVVPAFSQKVVELKQKTMGKKKNPVLSEEGGLWLKGEGDTVVKIDLYDPEDRRAKGVHAFIFGKDSLLERIDAETARWDGATWVLEKIIRYDLRTGSVEKKESITFPGLEHPDFFENEVRKPEDMGLAELFRYASRLRDAGFRNQKILVDINARISFPLVNVFMMVLGISLSARGRHGGGLLTAGLAFFISLCYWLGYTFTLMLGYSGILPPLLATWSVPAVVGALSVTLFLKIPE